MSSLHSATSFRSNGDATNSQHGSIHLSAPAAPAAVSPLQVQEWILRSNDPAVPVVQSQAAANLQEWTSQSSSSTVVSTLFQLLLLTSNKTATATANEQQLTTVQFYALTTLGRLPLQQEERGQLRSYLLLQTTPQNSSILRNKVALLITRCIVQDVPDNNWATVETDLLSVSDKDPLLFLKTVETLLEELTQQTDNNIQSTRESIRRVKQVLKNTDEGYDATTTLEDKPTMLERLFDRVVRLLGEGLHRHHQSVHNKDSNGATTTTDLTTQVVLALQTIKGFFAWTEPSLFLGQQQQNAHCILELLLVSLQPDKPAAVQLAALEAWQEWILSSAVSASSSNIDNDNNTMMDDPKLPVLSTVMEKLHEYNVLPYTGESKADIEVVIQVAKLINAAGLQVLPVWEQEQEQSFQNGSPVSSTTLLMNQVLDLFFRAFAYDDIDVSTAVLPFAARLSVSIEDSSEPESKDGSPSSLHGSAAANNNNTMQRHLPQLLNTLYAQLKYPVDFCYDYQDEEDAEEEVYRAELCKLYSKLVYAAPAVCLQFVCEAAAQWLSNGSIATAPTPDLEATLRLIYHYCERIRPAPGLKVVMRNETFCALLVALHSSDISSHSHRQVLMQYYEVAVRYYPIFQLQEQNSALLSKLLAAMSGSSGLQNEHPRVRSRCCYLLLRLVKSVVALLRPFVETAVTGIQGLLLSGSQKLELRPDDTLYLFETMGLLLGKTGLEATDQQRYLTQVMTPHVRSIEQVLATPGLARDAEHYGEVLSGSIAAITHLSKGFAKPSEPVQLVLVETVNVTLTVLEALPMSEHVRGKSMVLLQRMIQCLGARVLPVIPKFLFLLIEHCTAEDILFVAQIFNQLCIKFKQDAVPVVDAALLPFLRKCHSLVPALEDVADSDVPPHLRTEQLSIQKLAFVVLQHVVTHNATAVLVSPTNVGSLETVLQTMGDGAIHVNDPVIRKTCIRFFRELIGQWGDMSSAGGHDVYQRGLMTFVCRVLVPGMFQSMLAPSFDERDAMQARTVSEFAHVLFLIKSKSLSSEEMYRQYVLSNLSGMGRVPPDLLDAIGSVSSATELEACLHELFRIVKREGQQQR